jgi:hypothetical protein
MADAAALQNAFEKDGEELVLGGGNGTAFQRSEERGLASAETVEAAELLQEDFALLLVEDEG